VNNKTTVLKEPTNEQKESCWDYLKNKGTKAKKWFAGWFSTSKTVSDSVDDDAELIKLEVKGRSEIMSRFWGNGG